MMRAAGMAGGAAVGVVAGQAIYDNFGGAISEAGADAFNAVQDFAPQAMDFASSVGNDVGNFAQDAGDAIGSFAQDAGSAIESAFGGDGGGDW